MKLILFLPLLVSIISFFAPKKVVKELGLSFSFSFLAYSLLLLLKFDPTQDFDIKYEAILLESLGAQLSFGLDGLGMLMLILTNFVVLFVNLIAFKKTYDNRFYGLLFMMQFALIGVFSCLNAFFFYVFWELALIPIYLILLMWGEGKNKKAAFVRFFVYTFLGSLMLLAGFILFNTYSKAINYQYVQMVVKSLEGNQSIAFALLMIVGFGVKIPIFPLHSWQAKTYVKAPSEGTILLSAIMLKMGLYGLIRWYVPFIDAKIPMIQTVAILLAVFGVVFGALIALRRNNLKQIAAFSSLSHVGLIAAGIFTANIYGLQGSIIQMVVHGINILGLFYVIDIIKNQTGTLNIQKLGGIASKAPKFAVLSLIIILGTISVPLTNGFPGEMLLLMSVFVFNPFVGAVAGLTIIIGAAYMLRIYQLTFFRTTTAKTEGFQDVSGIDFVALLIIAFLVLAIGFYPQFILDLSQTTSNHLVNLLSARLF